MAGLKKLAEEISGEGRYGDSELVHMAPEEIAALEEILGDMTINPETGQKEAFSWWKALAGIGLLAASVPTGGASLLGMAGLTGGSLAAAAAIGTTLGAGLLTGSVADKKKKEDDGKPSEAGAYLDSRNAAIMKEMYKFPEVNIKNPAAVASPIGAQQQWFIPPMGKGIAALDQSPQRYAEGGMLEPEEMEAQMVMAEAMAALEGKHPNPEEAINKFIAMFGKEALEELKSGISQGGGMGGGMDKGMIDGPGGGMDDMVSGSVGGQKLLASNSEYIVPGDAVSGLGDGSSEAGGRELDAMVERIRMAKTGVPQQPPKIDKRKVMPV